MEELDNDTIVLGMVKKAFRSSIFHFFSFSVTDSVTLSNVRNLWLKELRQHAPEAQVLLAGTKADLRGNKPEEKREGERYEEVRRGFARHSYLQLLLLMKNFLGRATLPVFLLLSQHLVNPTPS